ncbi:acetyltransferase, GNAT family [Synechococcus sp. PCC 7335]|uniref:GNAT family N-acetyltransferase n=2 Tax=Synechococcus sp. (strain ATCC 29403 / PCC 7335) TaxID=91464 RepID=UPI00017EB1B0|nr:GNAT family N-acetyltransferase [Synechococcus sp. PCC 7335]EDX83285.1 acetyltransferase, GNAT family [Synechococcus sp. PCC 7335]
MTLTREATYDDIPVIAQVHVDTWRDTYSGIIPDEVLADLSYEKRENSWQRVFAQAADSNGFTYVSEDENGQVVGFIDGGRERTDDRLYRGEINAIYILSSHQHQGIGRELVRLAVKKLWQMDIQSMLVWVLEDNPACKFYEALGGQIVRSKSIEMRGSTLIEYAYGWTDTSLLLRPVD